ncbi:hypothetical protein NDU88_008063 [Pleurodeles waltl]|uniref:Uncharacterized protein n=1 Tax=Pleurodeles waltl TaxID=8319 RepID=A0AAV7NWM9_PLEWA|nr:hypothetical protein NDU88_008063 [Pleurodeles waltl]
MLPTDSRQDQMRQEPQEGAWGIGTHSPCHPQERTTRRGLLELSTAMMDGSAGRTHVSAYQSIVECGKRGD